MSKYFIRDTESIKRAVWFVEKNNGVTVDDTYLQEWTELTEQYNENPSSELFMKLYYHYPSVMTLLRIIHPDDFDDVVVDTVVAKMEGKIMIGCINTTIINHLVTLFADIMNWNSQSKELYVLCKCDSTDLKLSWKRVSQSFDLYLIGIFERITEKLLHMLEDTVDAKLFGKIVTELGKLPKYVPTFYAKNAYKRQASHTNNFTSYDENIMIFKNGYLDLNTDEVTYTIVNVFDDFNQCMNIDYTDVEESTMSKDAIVKYTMCLLNQMFYNKIDKQITIVYGSRSRSFIQLFESLFGTYITRVSMKDFNGKTEFGNKFIIIDSPSELSVSLISRRLHDRQNVFIDCSNNQLPKLTGTFDPDKVNIFPVNHDIFDRLDNRSFFEEIFNATDEIETPFSINIDKENLMCEANSAEYFCKSMIDYEEDETYTETELYKKYIAFCKANKLPTLTVLSLYNVIRVYNINITGDIGSRVYSGFGLRN